MNRYEIHSQICKELNELYRKKDADYGNSVGETYKKLGMISMVTRLSDKMNRLTNLTVKEANKKNITMKEIVDCVKDLPDDVTKEQIVECICDLMAKFSAEDVRQVKDESIEDTLMDLANYALIALIERRCEKEENECGGNI